MDSINKEIKKRKKGRVKQWCDVILELRTNSIYVHRDTYVHMHTCMMYMHICTCASMHILRRWHTQKWLVAWNEEHPLFPEIWVEHLIIKWLCFSKRSAVCPINTYWCDKSSTSEVHKENITRSFFLSGVWLTPPLPRSWGAVMSDGVVLGSVKEDQYAGIFIKDRYVSFTATASNRPAREHSSRIQNLLRVKQTPYKLSS